MSKKTKKIKIRPYSDAPASPSALGVRHGLDTENHFSEHWGSMEWWHWDYKQKDFPNLFPLHPDFDCGIRVVDLDGVVWETRVSEKIRTAELSVNDMLYSLGAQHYYARIKIRHAEWVCVDSSGWAPRWKEDKRPDVGQCCCRGGHWLPNEYKNRDMSGLCLKIERPLSAKEIRKNPDRYTAYEPGDPTDGWNTPEEAWQAGIRFFQNQFAPGWALTGTFTYDKVDPYSDDDDSIRIVSAGTQPG